jgi:hypothetical protein
MQVLPPHEHREVARALAATGAQLTKVEDARPVALTGYDLIGFSSGIYGLKHHKTLIELIEAVPAMGKNVFVFLPAAAFERSTTSRSRRSLLRKIVRSSASSPALASAPARCD